VTITVQQLIELGTQLITLNRPFMVIGQPGVGKTDGIKRIGTITNRHMFISHPAIDAPEDYKGFGFFQDGKADFFPMGMMSEILNCTEPSIWFIDDLGQAPIAVQNAIMQFVHHRNRTLNGKKIPEHVAIVAASNRREDNAGVTGITDPLKGRFTTIVEVTADLVSWTDWATQTGIDPLIIAYLHYRPANLSAFEACKDFRQSPTPRGWESINELMHLAVNPNVQMDMYSGAIGPQCATEFIQFTRILDQLPDLDDIEANGERAQLPGENQARYAVCGALSVRGQERDKLTQVMKYIGQLPSEYRVLWSVIWSKNNKEKQDWPEWTSWVLQNQDILSI
jgi:hypothetical protein